MKRASIVLLAGLALALSCPAFATYQLPDVLLLEGHIFDIYHPYPLEDYFAEKFTREEKEEALNPDILDSGLLRGYIAFWEIRDHKLFLVRIEVKYDIERPTVPLPPDTVLDVGWRKVPLNAIFPEEKIVELPPVDGHDSPQPSATEDDESAHEPIRVPATKGVQATWFSGENEIYPTIWFTSSSPEQKKLRLKISEGVVEKLEESSTSKASGNKAKEPTSPAG
jgi:hypothetical protein